MMRCSARQQNLSQDMMAETLAQENHCFSISSNTKYNRPSNTKTDIIILPEMVNANLSSTRTHHKIEIQNKMDEIHGKQDQQVV
jgi:hypothetical protein